MRYSKTTELALDSLFYMAAHPERSDFFVDELAQAQNVSNTYLAKIFQQLAKSGLLRSHRGSKGGYTLGRDPEAITLLDVAQVFEGASPIFDCDASNRNCALGPRCLIMSTFKEAERRMFETLKSVNLKDLCANLRVQSSRAEWVNVESTHTRS
jgi:Rrf2 family protein